MTKEPKHNPFRHGMADALTGKPFKNPWKGSWGALHYYYGYQCGKRKAMLLERKHLAAGVTDKVITSTLTIGDVLWG